MKATFSFTVWLALAPVARADIADTPAPGNARTAADSATSGMAPTSTATPPVALPTTPADVGGEETPAAPPPPAVASPNAQPSTPGPQITVVSAASARFETANASYDAGRFADAVREFTGFVQEFPGDRRAEEALFHLAEAYRQLGRTSDALAAYTCQAGRFPEGPFRANAELQRGAILFDQAKFAEAVAPLQAAFDRGDGILKEDAQYLLGRAFLATQKDAAGRALLLGLAAAQPPGRLAGGAAQALAEADDAQGRPLEALAGWRKALALLPQKSAQAAAAARGGWSALAARQPDAARKLFEQARELGASGPVLDIANTGLLRVLFAQKDYPYWLKVHDAAQDHLLADAQPEVMYDLGHAEFALKMWPDAVVAFDAYLGQYPDSPAAPAAGYERMLASIQGDAGQTAAQADAYLKTYPQSPYRARVLLLEAQEFSRENNFAAAAPLWEKLATEPASPDWPRSEILLERARAYDALHQWTQAATAYRAYLDGAGNGAATMRLGAEARLAVALQNDNQTLAATEAWQAVQADAPAGSPDQQVALESLGLIHAHGGPAQAALMTQTFRTLLEKFPQTKLRGLAAFSVGDYLFGRRDYSGADPFLREARTADATTWDQAATQRLALSAYSRRDWPALLNDVQDYDSIPGAHQDSPLPAPLYYALAQNARQTGNLAVAEGAFRRVTTAPDAGDLRPGAWWQLGQVQAAEKKWSDAAQSYGRYEQLKPEAARATSVLLALGRAQLGAQQLDAARATANQALLQSPEGPDSAAARMLLAETSYASGSFAEAARMFATLALLFDNAPTGPQAISRAADSFDKAGDAKSAADWRARLQAKYPGFRPSPYL